jgi:hypothetical protein
MRTTAFNPVFQPNVNQAQINREILKTADQANRQEFFTSINDGSIQAIVTDPTLTPEQKATQALLIQQGRTINLLT